MKCQICDKGEVVEKEEKNHETMVLGQELTLPEAIVGRCDTCGAVNYAFRKEEHGNVVDKWAERSKGNEVCGILGCRENPTTQCAHCGLHYCDEHKFVVDGPGHQRGSV